MLDRSAIAARLPHTDSMCLLDRIVAWDERGIRCTARSHRDAANPLRERDGLPVWAGIEYAAQAAAMHGALTHPTAAPREGVLAALRNVTTACDWLDRAGGELTLDATLLHGNATGAIYRFEVRDGADVLTSGQFTLMFAAAMPPARP